MKNLSVTIEALWLPALIGALTMGLLMLAIVSLGQAIQTGAVPLGLRAAMVIGGAVLGMLIRGLWPPPAYPASQGDEA